VKLIEVFVIVALGFWPMYYGADNASATMLGMCYLIVMGAIIIVLNADSYERQLKRLFRSGKL
jgi:hypothetical protein